MLTLNETSNGNLAITIDKTASSDDIAELKDRAEEVGELPALIEYTESYWTNGGYLPFDAGVGNPNVGLTDAPCIAENMDRDDDGNATIDGKFWYFPNYAVESFLDTLITRGTVEFTLGPQQ